MIVLITGASHTGKTLLTQRLLEKHQFPYLSIRPSENGANPKRKHRRTLTDYLWPNGRMLHTF